MLLALLARLVSPAKARRQPLLQALIASLVQYVVTCACGGSLGAFCVRCSQALRGPRAGRATVATFARSMGSTSANNSLELLRRLHSRLRGLDARRSGCVARLCGLNTAKYKCRPRDVQQRAGILQTAALAMPRVWCGWPAARAAQARGVASNPAGLAGVSWWAVRPGFGRCFGPAKAGCDAVYQVLGRGCGV